MLGVPSTFTEPRLFHKIAPVLASRAANIGRAEGELVAIEAGAAVVEVGHRPARQRHLRSERNRQQHKQQQGPNRDQMFQPRPHRDAVLFLGPPDAIPLLCLIAPQAA